MLVYNQENACYEIDGKALTPGLTVEVLDVGTNNWVKGKVQKADRFENGYGLLLFTCEGSEMGIVDMKYYSQGRIV